MTKDQQKRLFSRRQVYGAIALGIAAVGFYRKGSFDRALHKSGFNFKPLGDPAGFRLLETGPVTFGGVPLFGLGNVDQPELVTAEALIDADICAALFDSTPSAGTVPAAFFYDFQCPICRRLTPILRNEPGISLTWHDLAGLGPASETAAKAAIAARAQGGFDAFHDRLMRARFQPNEGYILALADSIGLDQNRLRADMTSDATQQRMWLSRALADRLAMVGTPGLVIGSTILLGNVTADTLKQIIKLEANRPAAC